MFKGLMLYLQLHRDILEIDKADFSNAYEMLKRVVDKFVVNRQKTAFGEVYIITSGSAYYFENAAYLENVIIPSIQKFSFAKRLFSPFVNDVVAALDKDEKWIVFGPIKEDLWVVPKLYHLIRTNKMIKKAVCKTTSKLIRKIVTGCFLEFRITISPAFLEEIDIYQFPEKCSEILEQVLFENKVLSIGDVVYSRDKFYVLDEADIDRFFEVAEGYSSARSLEIAVEELTKPELQRQKSPEEFIQFLISKTCKFFYE